MLPAIAALRAVDARALGAQDLPAQSRVPALIELENSTPLFEQDARRGESGAPLLVNVVHERLGFLPG